MLSVTSRLGSGAAGAALVPGVVAGTLGAGVKLWEWEGWEKGVCEFWLTWLSWKRSCDMGCDWVWDWDSVGLGGNEEVGTVCGTRELPQ